MAVRGNLLEVRLRRTKKEEARSGRNLVKWCLLEEKLNGMVLAGRRIDRNGVCWKKNRQKWRLVAE